MHFLYSLELIKVKIFSSHKYQPCRITHAGTVERGWPSLSELPLLPPSPPPTPISTVWLELEQVSLFQVWGRGIRTGGDGRRGTGWKLVGPVLQQFFLTSRVNGGAVQVHINWGLLYIPNIYLYFPKRNLPKTDFFYSCNRFFYPWNSNV